MWAIWRPGSGRACSTGQPGGRASPEIGRTFYDRCKLLLADAAWADLLVEETRGEPRGRLRLNAPVSFGSESRMPVVTRYLRDHPGVDVDLVLSDRFVDLDEDAFEAVFRTGPLADSSLAAHELTPFRLVGLSRSGWPAGLPRAGGWRSRVA